MRKRSKLLSQQAATYWRANRSALIILALIILGYWILTTVWRAEETRPPHWDMGRHLWTAENYRQYLVSGNITQLLVGYAYYPPVLYVVTGAWMTVFGKNLLSAVAANGIWIALLSASLYAITRRLATRRAGLLTVVFALTLPLVSSVIKDLQIDMPMAALLMFNLFCLMRSDRFERLDWSVIYGISFALGMLTKWSFVFFALWPLAYIGSKLIIARDGKSIKNLCIAVLLAHTIAAPWYWHNIVQLKIDFVDNGYQAGIREGDPAAWSLGGILYYPTALLRYYLHAPWLIVVFGTLIAGVRRWRLLRNDMVLPFFLCVGGTIVLTCLGNKDPRYILPVTMGLAIYVGIWIDGAIRRGWHWAMYSLVGLMVVSYLATSFLGRGLQPVAVDGTPLKVWDTSGYITGPPTHENWCQEAAVRQARTIGTKMTVAAADSIWFNQWAFQYYTLREAATLVPLTDAEVVIGRGEQPATRLWECTLPSGELVWVARPNDLVPAQ